MLRFICGLYYNELAYPIFNETNAFFSSARIHSVRIHAKNQFSSIIHNFLVPNRLNCCNATRKTEIKENEKADKHPIAEIGIIIIMLETNIKILLYFESF